MSRRSRALAGALLLAGLAPAAAPAADPDRWKLVRRSVVPITYYQGVTSDPARALYFDGIYVGAYRTTPSLRETAATARILPAEVTAQRGYDHLGDLSYDRAEGGRLLLPLECYRPGGPNGGNTCGRGAIGVADPRTLRWRYHVELDPRDIPKAMWNEVSPDGRLVWTSSGRDLLAYRTADVTPANAYPQGAPLRPVRRLAGAVPPSGITGATFHAGRLLLAGQARGEPMQVWSVDPRTGFRRLEIERAIVGESEGLDVVRVLGGELHWLVQPFPPSPTPTYREPSLLTFALTRPAPIAVRVAPRRLVVGRTVRVEVRASAVGRAPRVPLAGATVRVAGRRATTGPDGRAVVRVRPTRPGRVAMTVSHPGLPTGRALVAVGGPQLPG